MTDTLAKSPPKKPKKVAKKQPEFTCDYCKKSYTKESTLLVHMCETKRRWLDQDTKHVKLGFMVFQRFHEINYRGRKTKDFNDFIKSNFYTAFTHFGRHLLNMNAINPKAFVDFLIRTEIPMKQWESEIVYETYIRELNKKETPDAAIERNFMLMLQWSIDNGEPWTDFFRKISPAQATLWIKSGRISPWILFTAASAADLFSRLSTEQLEFVRQMIDPAFWEIKLKRSKEDVEFIQKALDEVGL